MARGAVVMSESADAPEARGNALVDLAEVLLMAQDRKSAAAALAAAIEQFERKGMVVPADRARARLDSLTSADDRIPTPPS
jgi:hypothetical protein